MAVSDVLRREKTMMVKRLLKLYSASKGTISHYLEKFNDLQLGKAEGWSRQQHKWAVI